MGAGNKKVEAACTEQRDVVTQTTIAHRHGCDANCRLNFRTENRTGFRVGRFLWFCRFLMGGVIVAGLAGCQGSLPQFNTPRFDSTVFVPPNPTQFARRDAALTPVTQADLVDASGNCTGAPPEGGALQRNVALQMTECEVVRLLGPPRSTDDSRPPVKR